MYVTDLKISCNSELWTEVRLTLLWPNGILLHPIADLTQKFLPVTAHSATSIKFKKMKLSCLMSHVIYNFVLSRTKTAVGKNEKINLVQEVNLTSQWSDLGLSSHRIRIKRQIASNSPITAKYESEWRRWFNGGVDSRRVEYDLLIGLQPWFWLECAGLAGDCGFR